MVNKKSSESDDLNRRNFGGYMRALILIGILSSSCHAAYRWPESQPVYVEAHGSRQFRRIVYETCDLITSLSRGAIVLQKGVGGVTVRRAQVNPFYGTCRLEVTGSEITGAAVQVSSSLRIRNRGDRLILRLVVLHELLHAIGLDHSDDPNSIMFPIVHGQSVSAWDVYLLQSLYWGKP